MAKKITFRIDKEGNITSDIQGVKGPACLEYIGLIKDLTKGEIIETEKTKEYYENVEIDQYDEVRNTSK